MAKCERCGKSARSGHNVSHSMRHTGRWWHPNTQTVRVAEKGKTVRKKLCTRCLRTMMRTPA